MRANAIKNTTPCMPARVWGPRGAPGAPQAFRSASQVSPRRGAGAAQAQPRRCSCCQASPGAPGTRERRKTKARGRRCQAPLGAPSTPSSSWALPGAAQSLQGVARRSQARHRCCHSGYRRFQTLLGAPRPQGLPGAPQTFQALLSAPQALPNGAKRKSQGTPKRSTGVTRRIKAPRGVSWRPRGVPWRSQALPRRSQASPSAPWRSPDAPRRTPCTSKRSPVAPRRCQAPPSAPRRIARLSLWRRAKLHNASPMRRQSAVESYPLVASTPCRTAAASDWSVA